jgi:hypothetical protein
MDAISNDPEKLMALMDAIEADKRKDIEGRYAAVAAKFEAERGEKDKYVRP